MIRDIDGMQSPNDSVFACLDASKKKKNFLPSTLFFSLVEIKEKKNNKRGSKYLILLFIQQAMKKLELKKHKEGFKRKKKGMHIESPFALVYSSASTKKSPISSDFASFNPGQTRQAASTSNALVQFQAHNILTLFDHSIIVFHLCFPHHLNGLSLSSLFQRHIRLQIGQILHAHCSAVNQFGQIRDNDTVLLPNECVFVYLDAF